MQRKPKGILARAEYIAGQAASLHGHPISAHGLKTVYAAETRSPGGLSKY
jgi:hypothetical protein